MSKVKIYFLVNVYFIYRYSKIKNRPTAFPKLKAFNCKVSFLTYSDESSRHFTPEIGHPRPIKTDE